MYYYYIIGTFSESVAASDIKIFRLDTLRGFGPLFLFKIIIGNYHILRFYIIFFHIFNVCFA